MRALAKQAIPVPLAGRGSARRFMLWPPVGRVRLGGLRRVTPISRSFGFDRGLPVDRHYIEGFLQPRATSVRGRVLEIGEDLYTGKFGTDVEHVDVLDVDKSNPRATIVADLAEGGELASEAYDCVICTQTLLLVYDVRAALRTLHRVLRPGGTLLVTVPGTCRICRSEQGLWEDYWRFTSASIRRLVEEAFERGDVEIEPYGNVLTATAFLYGLAAEELRPSELAARDPDYEVVIGVRAVKATSG